MCLGAQTNSRFLGHFYSKLRCLYNRSGGSSYTIFLALGNVWVWMQNERLIGQNENNTWSVPEECQCSAFRFSCILGVYVGVWVSRGRLNNSVGTHLQRWSVGRTEECLLVGHLKWTYSTHLRHNQLGIVLECLMEHAYRHLNRSSIKVYIEWVEITCAINRQRPRRIKTIPNKHNVLFGCFYLLINSNRENVNC